MLEELFLAKDAELIKQTSLSRCMIEDRLIWTKSNLGFFIVKSAYVVARRLLGREVQEAELRSPSRCVLLEDVCSVCSSVNETSFHNEAVGVFEVVFNGLWLIWQNRNWCRFKDTCGSVASLVNRAKKNARLRVVIRNFAGEVLFSVVQRNDDVQYAMNVEALAILFGVSIYVEKVLSNILMESDSLDGYLIRMLGSNEDVF
ncbi:hypothetical protein REPUB_Repub06bG0139500 [Reevesia pubescens]